MLEIVCLDVLMRILHAFGVDLLSPDEQTFQDMRISEILYLTSANKLPVWSLRTS